MKSQLQRYLQIGREVLVWKMEGLSEYDVRRPLVRSGTNLLGIVKHVATVEAGYFGEVFGRPFPEPMPWIDDANPGADMWATTEESPEEIVQLYQRVWAHSDVTIEELSLDSVGHVAWWPAERQAVTLHQILVHMTTETHRHAGHADILREMIDGGLGHRREVLNVEEVDDEWWEEYRAMLERVAREAGGR
jgi:hypothetical protein